MRLTRLFVGLVPAAVLAVLTVLLVDCTTAPGAEGPAPKQSVKQTLRIPVHPVREGKPVAGLKCVVRGGPFVPQAAVALSPDGKLLAAAGYGEVLLWDLERATLARRLSHEQLGTSIGALLFLEDGALLAVGSGTPGESGAVAIFGVPGGKLKSALTEPEDVVLDLDTSPDGKLLAAGAADTQAYVWNIEDGKLVTTITDHSGWVLDVAFNQDGKRLATAGADRVLRVWDTAEWHYAATFIEEDAVRSVVFVPDGRTLLLAIGGSETRYLQARQLTNVRYRRTVSLGGGLMLDMHLVEQKGKLLLLVSGSDGMVRVLDGRVYRHLSSFPAHNDWVYALAVGAEGKRLATAAADGTVKLWNAADNSLLATMVQLAPQSDQWLIVAEPGYVATSARKRLVWRAAQGAPAPEGIAELLEKPDLVREALSGTRPKAPEIP